MLTTLAILTLLANPWSLDPVCPLVYAECLPPSTSDPVEIFEHAPLLLPLRDLQPYERLAIRLLTDQGKGLWDLLDLDCGTSGAFHRPPTQDADPYDLGWTSDDQCPIQDPAWRQTATDFLYSPYSAAIQLRTWRLVISPATSAAHQAGVRDPRTLAVVACIANSSPVLAQDLGLEHDWDPRAMLQAYVDQRPTRHRTERARRLLQLLDDSP